MIVRSQSRAVHRYVPLILLGTCFVLWMVFVGNVHGNELIVGAVSVVLATAFFVFVQGHQEHEIVLNVGDTLEGLWIPWYIVVGLWEILLVLSKDLARTEPAKSLFLVQGRLGLPSAASCAVDVSGRIAGVVGSKLNIDACQLGRLTRAAQWIALSEVNKMLLGRTARDLKRRPDRARRDSIHANAFGSELLGKRLHEVHRRSLGLGVVI